jgi:hypothetical protein
VFVGAGGERYRILIARMECVEGGDAVLETSSWPNLRMIHHDAGFIEEMFGVDSLAELHMWR